MKVKIISILVILLWLIVIFCFSNMNSDESNDKSKGAIQNIVKTSINISNTIHLTNIELTEEKLDQITNNLNYPLRKVMHASVYFILALLLLIVLNKNNVTDYKLYLFTIIFCIIYAITDEVHQLYVSERTGQPLDVLIDTTGSVLGLLVYKIGHNKSKSKND